MNNSESLESLVLFFDVSSSMVAVGIPTVDPRLATTGSFSSNVSFRSLKSQALKNAEEASENGNASCELSLSSHSGSQPTVWRRRPPLCDTHEEKARNGTLFAGESTVTICHSSCP